jgi:hypothetical protein
MKKTGRSARKHIGSEGEKSMVYNLARPHALVPATRYTSDAVIKALTQVWPTAVDPHAARLYQHGFAWFAEANQQEAFQHVQAAVIAAEQCLARQVTLQIQQAQTIVLRDLADRVQALVQQQAAYRGLRHVYPYPVSDSFIVYESDETLTSYEWHYTSIQSFERLIPPRALAALALVEQAGLHPQAYWVADKWRTATRVTLDPILSAQYGPFLVAIAEWL